MFGCVIARLVPLGLGQNAQKRRIGRRHPMAKRIAAQKHGHPGQQAVEEVECAHRPHADEVEECPLHAQVREGLVQALEDPIASRVVRVCLHRLPLTLEKLEWRQLWPANSDSPEPAQDVDGKHGDAGPGGHSGQGLLRARLAMRKLIAAYHNGD